MRFMVMVRSTEQIESGEQQASKELATDMMRYNEELAKAGVLLAGDGLLPSAKGARVRFSGGQTTVMDGPFTEAKELIAGYWLLQCRSLDEAIEWVKRVPNTDGTHGEIEIRQVAEAGDFGDEAGAVIEAYRGRLWGTTAQPPES